MSFCRQDRVLHCDQILGLLTGGDDCDAYRTCHAFSATEAWCI
jgi:hypothetical protein